MTGKKGITTRISQDSFLFISVLSDDHFFDRSINIKDLSMDWVDRSAIEMFPKNKRVKDVSVGWCSAV